MFLGKFFKYIVFICLVPLGLKAQTNNDENSEYRKSAAELHWDAINRHRDQIERGGNLAYNYATCGNTFPIAIGKSKKIVLSGYIKTADLTDGWAGLWWRIDRKNNLYDVKNMRLNGPSGTTDWTPFSITLQAKKDAQTMDFGCVMAGNGRAWFDKLDIEIDGIQYGEYATLMGLPKETMPFLNLDFETLGTENTPAIWSTNGGDDYVVRIDSNIHYSGRYSLMMGSRYLEPGIHDSKAPIDTILKPNVALEDTAINQDKPTDQPKTTYQYNEIRNDSIKISLKQSGTGTTPGSAVIYVEASVPINIQILNTDKTLLIEKKGSKSIDISALSNGVYNVNVSDDKGHLLKSSKLLKE